MFLQPEDSAQARIYHDCLVPTKKIPFTGSIASCVFPSPCTEVTAKDLHVKKSCRVHRTTLTSHHFERHIKNPTPKQQKKKCFAMCLDQMGQTRAFFPSSGMVEMKPDSATQWNREDKPRVHGKQEQSMILHTAGPCSVPCKRVWVVLVGLTLAQCNSSSRPADGN